MSTAPTILPNNLELLKAMVGELSNTVDQKDLLIHQLQHQIKALIHQKFGRKSEAIDPKELLPFIEDLFGQEDNVSSSSNKESAEDKSKPTVKEKTKGHGRKPLPAHLPRTQVIHDIPDDQKQCSCCDQLLTCIDKEVTEQLDYIPASLQVIEHVQLKYACKGCRGEMALAKKPPMPIEKGIPGAGLLSYIITSKYLDHMPINRIHNQFDRFNVPLSRSTMCDWMLRVSEDLLPLYKLMHAQILKGDIIHSDDTPVKEQVKMSKSIRTSRVWCYLGSEQYPYQLFDYTPTRQREGPLNFLKGYEGYLQADAYAGYDELYKIQLIIEVLCWAHARRKFYDARDLDKEISHTALAFIKQLYKIECECKKLTPLEKFKARQQQALPILEAFLAWLEDVKKQMLPKNKLQEAVQYCLNHWQALLNYTKDGRLSIDNNSSERMMKQTAIGRKNWLFFGSARGGKSAAIFMSLVQSANRNDINAFEYLKDVISKIPTLPQSKLHTLLPDQWQPDSQ